MQDTSPILEDQQTLYQSARCEVRRVRYRLDGGGRADRPIVLSPGAVAIVARPTPTSVAMVRQYRYALGAWTLEIPAGTRGADEEPLACAQRELVEEAGYEAKQWREALAYHPAPGLTDQVMRVFIAEELTAVGNAPEADEALQAEVLSDDELRAAFASGAITDAKTIIGLSLIGLWMQPR